MNRLRTLLMRGLLLLASVFCTAHAWASCSYSPRMQIGDSVLNPGQVQVPQNAAVGATVATFTVGVASSSGVVWVGSCRNDGTTGNMRVAGQNTLGSAVAGQSNVYSTNIQGIGYRVRVFGIHSMTFPSTIGIAYNSDVAVYLGWSYVQFELVKTSSVVGNGPLTIGEYARMQVDGNPSQLYFRILLAGGSILTPTCNVDAGSQNLTVPMGSVYRNVFQGVGSVAAVKNFSIRLNCNALPAGQGNTVMMTMDASADPSGLPGVLRLATSGPGPIAGGVGIQVRNALGNPVVFGQAFDVGPSQPAGYTVNFTARHIQTTSTVTTGDANGLATVTLTYK